MGCGSLSKVNENVANKNIQNELQVQDIKGIIEQNLNEIKIRNPQVLIEEIEKQQTLKKQQQVDQDNNDKISNVSDHHSIKLASNKTSPKTTQETIISKQDLMLTQAISKYSHVFYTEILQKEVFKLSSKLKKHISIGQFNRNVNQAKRIQNEIRILVKNLPIYSTNSIFVRCNELDTNHFQCIIMGSKDTPYAYGAFTYDLHCDYNFPSCPPKMRLITTGGGSVRFNPNLYKDGFICLSLLGTWNGQKNEKWNESSSNILQILISIQSLVMNDQVYYNEPSVEKQNPENEMRNRAYQNIIKISNIRHAMIDQLKNPDPEFRDIIKMHFYLNKNEILNQCDKWIIDAKQSDASNTKYDAFVKSHNCFLAQRYKNDYSLYAKDLIDTVYELKQEIQRIDISTLPLYQEFLQNMNNQPEEKCPSIEDKQEQQQILAIPSKTQNVNQTNLHEHVIDKDPHLNDLVLANELSV
ncbi:hypothetical protein ABPG72_013328 [Tetrahymena utriculariae]